MKTKNRKVTRLISTLVAGFALLAVTERAEAQEIQLTGPLAGAPAVRKLRLYREGRFEISPAVTFSLLDEYLRTIYLGARLNYNFTDWLALGAWGAYGGLLQLPTHLTEEVQGVNEDRQAQAATAAAMGDPPPLNSRLTAVNMGPEFEDQLGRIDWVVAPQITIVPFRGKLALFSSIYLDTDLYFFGGPAFLGVKERAECGPGTDTGIDCTDAGTGFETTSRMAIAPTGGLGLSFYINKWSAIGFEGRIMPFSYNTGGFDTAGGGKDEKFPDNNITDADRRFQLNPTLTLSYNIYLPTKYRVSE